LNPAYAIGPIKTFLGLRRFPEAIDQTKLFMTRFPNQVDGYMARAHLESYRQNSLEPLRALLATHGNLLGPEYQQIVAVWIARQERRYLDEIKLLDKVPVEDPSGRAALVAFLYWAAGDTAHAEQLFRSVEREARVTTQKEPTQSDAFVRLALAQSVLGEHAAALASVEAARTLNPEHSDAVNGPHVSFIRSIILVRAPHSRGVCRSLASIARPFRRPSRIYGGTGFRVGSDRRRSALRRIDPPSAAVVKVQRPITIAIAGLAMGCLCLAAGHHRRQASGYPGSEVSPEAKRLLSGADHVTMHVKSPNPLSFKSVTTG
jgi:hypothetical protein